jgi:hypothetical protein
LLSASILFALSHHGPGRSYILVGQRDGGPTLPIALYEGLAEADIPIAFPQTDVHLGSSKPLEVKVSHDPQVD